MAKKQAGKSREKKAKNKTVVRTFGKGGNRAGGVQVIAPEPEPLDLGPITIPEGPEAERALRELGALNDRVLAAFKAMQDAQATAKSRKAKWDELSEELQKKIRRFTHKGDLPLFDAGEREADQARMESAAMAPPASQDGSGATNDVAETAF